MSADLAVQTHPNCMSIQQSSIHVLRENIRKVVVRADIVDQQLAGSDSILNPKLVDLDVSNLAETLAHCDASGRTRVRV